MADARVLVAGIGNVFLGDDAFGVEVAQLLLRRGTLQPPGAKVVDYGIRGFDLAYAMLDDYEATVLVDTTPRGEAPGTIYVLEPGLFALPDSAPPSDGGQGTFQGHTMTPAAVFHLVQTLGGKLRHVLIVGCEPESFGEENIGRMGLTDAVSQAVQTGADTVERLVHELLGRAVADPFEVASGA